MRRALFLAALVAMALPAAALELGLPANARLTAEVKTPMDSYAMATGPYHDGAMPQEVLEGQVLRQAWNIRGQSPGTLRLMTSLREGLEAEGFRAIYSCAALACGGFDFRFGIEVFAAPEMYVDLFNFRYLAARKDGPDGAEHVTLLVSRSAGAAYVQLVHVAPNGSAAPVITASAGVQADTAPGERPLAEALEQRGHVVLEGLVFETGSSALGAGEFAVLAELAEFLLADAARRVALVGHTDTEGGLDANIALSKRRAASVLERLVGDYGVPRGQLDAEGMGYLAPLASNLTAEGREANRRVEAVLLNTE